MKKVLMPHENGQSIWVVTHRLSLTTERHENVRAVHIWTFLGPHVMPPGAEEGYNLFMALENKLFGVRLARSRLREALSYALDPCYAHGNVQDYGAEQRVMLDTEAYLNAIYSALEIASRINKRQDPSLPNGFRSQAKNNKFSLFKFSNWSWLSLFYDLRAMFAHFASPFPTLNKGAFLLEVTNPSGLLQLKTGRHRIEFETVVSFADSLFSLLDIWSLLKLQGVPPETKILQIHRSNFVGPLKGKNATARPFLKMARAFQRLGLESLEDGPMRDIVADIRIRT